MYSAKPLDQAAQQNHRTVPAATTPGRPRVKLRALHSGPLQFRVIGTHHSVGQLERRLDLAKRRGILARHIQRVVHRTCQRTKGFLLQGAGATTIQQGTQI